LATPGDAVVYDKDSHLAASDIEGPSAQEAMVKAMASVNDQLDGSSVPIEPAKGASLALKPTSIMAREGRRRP